MSTEIKGRPVLRPAGNVALRHDIKDNRGSNTRKPTKKPPPSPPLKPSPSPPLKISPPNSQPSTPRPSLSRSPVLKPTPSPRLPLKKPSTSPSHIKPCPPYTHTSASLDPSHIHSGASLDPHIHHHEPPHPSHIQNHASPNMHTLVSLDAMPGMTGDQVADMGAASEPLVHTSVPSDYDSPDTAHTAISLRSSSELIYDLDFVNDELISSLHAPESCPGPCGIGSPLYGTEPPYTSTETSKKGTSSIPCVESPTLQRKRNPSISLSRSSSDNYQRSSTRNVKASSTSKNPIRIGSHSLDDASLSHLMAAKKAAACELNVQRRLKVSEYGRKPGKASRVAPDVSSVLPVMAEPQRCKFITAQSDPLYVAYHDQEWGVPVHDDRILFELLVLAGAQAELSWTTILHRREMYRDAFCGYEAASVALFNEKHIQSLEADKTLALPGGKIRGVVENARRILEVVEEFGSLDNYVWSFLNNKPMINSYRYPKQVPAKTSKSEFISKDLVKRGFRFVGPTIVYSFMQAAGMTNDHLVQCFRYHACTMQLTSSEEEAFEARLECHVGAGQGVECDTALLHMDVVEAIPMQLSCAHDIQTQHQHQGQLFNHPEIVHI